MKVNREELLAYLYKARPGVSRTGYITQSSCFVFQSSWVMTYNEEISCRVKTSLSPDLEGAVVASMLLNVLENMTDDEVELAQKKNEMQILGIRKKAGIRMEDLILLPIDRVVLPGKDEWRPLAEEFSPAIGHVCECAGTNDEEFLTVCVNITPDWVEASDRLQMCRYTVPTGVKQPVIVRAKSIKHVVKLGLTRVGETPDWIHFRNKTMLFSCRTFVQSYPDLLPYLQVDGEKTVLPRGAAEASRLGAIFCSEDKENNQVRVSLSDGHFVVRGEGVHGWSSADMDCSYRGDPISFRISPKTLEQLIESYTDCEVSPNKIAIRGESWQYAVSLASDEDTKDEEAPVLETDEEDDDVASEDDNESYD